MTNPRGQSDPVYLSLVIGHSSFAIWSPGRAWRPWISALGAWSGPRYLCNDFAVAVCECDLQSNHYGRRTERDDFTSGGGSEAGEAFEIWDSKGCTTGPSAPV